MKKTDDYQNRAEESIAMEDIPHLLKTMLTDMTGILVVEAKLFGHTLRAMIKITVLLGLLLVTGWLSGAGALVVALARLDAVSLMGSLLIVAAAHLIFSALALWRLKVVMRDLTFRESRASVNGLLTHARLMADGPRENK